MKKAIYGVGALALATQANIVSAGIDFGEERIDPNLRTGNDLVTSVQLFISYLATFLYVVAVIIAIYAGFQILTSTGDEDKVKKARQTLIYALVGLVVIFLASSIVSFVIDLLFLR